MSTPIDLTKAQDGGDGSSGIPGQSDQRDIFCFVGGLCKRVVVGFNFLSLSQKRGTNFIALKNKDKLADHETTQKRRSFCFVLSFIGFCYRYVSSPLQSDPKAAAYGSSLSYAQSDPNASVKRIGSSSSGWK